MEKEHILDEIRRTAVDGRPLGRDQFCTQTGIREHDWLGRYWAKWSDAQTEAGFEPLSFNPKFDDEYILERIAKLVGKLGKFPTTPEMQLERNNNPDFPNNRVIGRRWNRNALIERLVKFCATNPQYQDVALILSSIPRNPIKLEDSESDALSPSESGYVYLIRAQGAYKIGCTRAPYRR
ncbi:MAG: hypothetical protein WBQ95_00790, partial [Terracidiphilus sp.]